MRRLALFAAIWSTLTVAACGTDATPETSPDPTPNPSPETDVLRSGLTRNTAPAVASRDLLALVDGNNALAMSLYDRFRGRPGNFFYSPLSVSQALAMAWAGARGQTESQMATTLRFTLGQAALHPAMNALDLALASRGQGAQGADGKGFRLKLSNALWGQRGYTILSPFLDVLAVSYGAGLRVLDFQEHSEDARRTINEWVELQTEGKIKNLIDNLSTETRLVLTNTIYFNAAWKKVFPTQQSGNFAFHRLDGSTVSAPSMSITDNLPAATGAGWRAVELPYDGDELAMLIVVPDQGKLGDVEKTLCQDGIGSIVQALQSDSVPLTLPKWKVESKFKLKEELQAMGMPDAFSRMKANFTGINGGVEPLWIDEVIHQSFIKVDENGTEAAAATALVMAGGAMPSAPLVVDRPFLYVIRDRATGSILFAGRVVDPTDV